MAAESNSTEEIIKKGKFTFHKNFLFFQNKAYSATYICSVILLDKTITLKKELPQWLFLCLILGCVLLGVGLDENTIATSIAGGLFISIGILQLFLYKPEIKIPLFLIEFELNSNKKLYFMFNDKSFVTQAVDNLLQIMGKGLTDEKLTIDLDTKTITLEKPDNLNEADIPKNVSYVPVKNGSVILTKNI